MSIKDNSAKRSYMQPRTSEYTERVDAWLSAHGITCVIERIGSSEGFVGEVSEKGERLMMHDTYRATVARDGKAFIVPMYYQAAGSSESEIARTPCTRGCPVGYRESMRHSERCAANPRNAERPTTYDILSCVQKSDPGTFEEFCSDLGYDSDSRKAEQTYFAVQREWLGVRGFFTVEELDELQEVAS